MPVLCGFHHIYYPENDNAAMQHEIQRYYRDPQVVPYDDLYAIDEPILKVALCDTNGPAKEAYPVMHEALGDAYELLISGDCWMDIMCKGVTKGAALQGLQERMGITPAETMAFGDYDNDISMLQHAEFSYAMENASERVRQQAKHIAPANTKNGVVRVLCETLGIHMESL